MALFQAVTILCRYAMTPERATAYRQYLKQWVDDLYTCHPHTKYHAKRPNVHIAFHLYDFAILWGPLVSWWAFPVERLIGVLQKINSNGRVGGEHEATVLTTWMRAANLRRWLKRPNCPKVLRQFHHLFSLHHGSRLENLDARPGIETEPRKKGLKSGEQAYYDFAGMHFSKAETHVGNSLVSYLDAAGKIWFGSIEKIKVTPQGSVSFAIRHQERLPDGKKDPFKEFAHFPARTYSSKMAETLVDVSPSQVLGHYARFKFSGGRAVVLDLRRPIPSVYRLAGASTVSGAHRLSRQPSARTALKLLTLDFDPPRVYIAWRWVFRSKSSWDCSDSSNFNRSGPRPSAAAFDIFLELLLPSISAFLHEFHGAKPSMWPEHHQRPPRVGPEPLETACGYPRKFNLSDSMLSGAAFNTHLEPSLAKVNRWTETVCCADAAAFRRFQTKPLTRVLTLACEWHSNPLSLPKSQSLGEGSNRLPTAD
ncbi:hypothetical protein B0H11DRAFT_2225072 [Mycena galericulata]|nr:hypothetical protein B0H11DRAFT_2225072 [Mycena galericulata]